jgi:hypothetical protein
MMKGFLLTALVFSGMAVLANADDQSPSMCPAASSATPSISRPDDVSFQEWIGTMKRAATAREPARKHFEKALAAFKAGRGTAKELIEAHHQWTQAEQAACGCALFSELTPEQASKLVQPRPCSGIEADSQADTAEENEQEIRVISSHENCIAAGAMYARGLSEALVEGALTEEEARDLAAGFEAIVAARKARVDLLRTISLLERLEKCKHKEAAEEARQLLGLLPQRKGTHLVRSPQPGTPTAQSAFPTPTPLTAASNKPGQSGTAVLAGDRR